jgi:hypothetical protein
MPAHIARGNATRARVRSRVEHVFAAQKCRLGLIVRTSPGWAGSTGRLRRRDGSERQHRTQSQPSRPAAPPIGPPLIPSTRRAPKPVPKTWLFEASFWLRQVKPSILMPYAPIDDALAGHRSNSQSRSVQPRSGHATSSRYHAPGPDRDKGTLPFAATTSLFFFISALPPGATIRMAPPGPGPVVSRSERPVGCRRPLRSPVGSPRSHV